MTTISGCQSERISGVRFTIADGDQSVVSVIGVYIPCLDQGLDVFVKHLLELDHVVCESKLMGTVFILGDFNAHLGTLGGQRCPGNTNT